MKKEKSRDISLVLAKAKKIIKSTYKNKLVDVILYGSYARGSSTKESDIDLAVILKGKINKVKEMDRLSDALYTLTLETGELISANPLSEKELNNRIWPLYYNIKAGGRKI